jgi:PHD/YefM family antitoxin component YafN of YafNO toxin-antitoxin module
LKNLKSHLTVYQKKGYIYTIKRFGGIIMPAIRETTDLLNKFNEIREFCQNYREPIFLTNNGQGELAVMSIETYEELVGRLELYQAVEVGLNQIENGETITEEEMLEHIKNL